MGCRRYIKDLYKKVRALQGTGGSGGVSSEVLAEIVALIPTNVSELNNDSGYLTQATIPSNENATSGGSTLSLVTTGEKYNWNNKANIWRGTRAQYDLLTPDDNTIYIITAPTS